MRNKLTKIIRQNKNMTATRKKFEKVYTDF